MDESTSTSDTYRNDGCLIRFPTIHAVFWPVDVEFDLDDVKNYILDDVRAAVKYHTCRTHQYIQEIKEILVDKVPPGVNLVVGRRCLSSSCRSVLFIVLYR